MNPIARNVLAVISGIVVGGLVNMGLVNLGPSIVPLPEGADISTTDGLRESIKIFTPVNFLFPFLAHALGSLSGAFVAAKIAANSPMRFSLIVGGLFLIGGVMMVRLVGGPLWFCTTDLLLAYIPAGYLGGFLGRGRRG